MAMTFPCNTHQAVWHGYKKLEPRAVRPYSIQERHQLAARDKYVRYVNERRRRRFYSEVVSCLVADVPQISISLEERFQEQANKWRRETEHLSSPSQMMTHPSYQAILGMAQENKPLVIRLLLHDLQTNRRPWFWALSYLTQDNPIKQADAGKIDRMIKAWVEWGKERDLL